MQPITQEDKTGCGLASVATSANVSYQEVKRVAGKLGIQVQDPQLWSDTKYVRQLLTHYGLSTSPRKKLFKSWGKLPPLALLAIKWHIKDIQDFWHWVIFWRGPEGMVT